MKLKTFVEKFDQFANAPDAVAKMRELILRLAVIGKLCPQDSSEEPASALLAKIVGANKSRYASGEIRLRDNARVFTGLDAVVPDGWSSVALGEIADVNWGNTNLTKKSYAGSGFTAYSATGPDGCIDHAEFSGPGIVLSAIGARSGKCFLAEGQWTAIKNTITIIPFSPISNDWLFLAINRESAWKKRGGAQPFIALKDAISLPILLPPLAEQKRIVAKVDEFMALCDRLEAQQQERETRHAALVRASLARFADAPTPANLPFLFHPSYTIPPKDLRKSILTLSVQGKLVPQDPSDESALALLDQIAAQKASLAKEGRYRGSATVKPMEDDEAEFELPSNWCWVHFGEIMINRDGERIPVSKEERETKAKTYDYYGASGVIDKIDGYLFDKPLLLIGEDGANLINRSTPIAFIARGKYWVNNHAHVLDGISEEFLQFIELHINAINLEQYVTGSAQPKMNQAKMNSIPIALPPLAEQRRIVAKSDQLMALVDEMETQLAASHATAANLLSALVAELTTQA